MEELAKNLWLLLTIAVPGMATYGTFRLLLLFMHEPGIDRSAFQTIDSSGVLTTAVILAIGTVQQAIGITIESGIALVCTRCRDRHPNFHSLFCQRFRLAASGKLGQDATRILASVFTSLNVMVGQLMILMFLLWCADKSNWGEKVVISCFAAAAFISVVFRVRNAVSIVSLIEQNTAIPENTSANLVRAKAASRF